MMAAMLPVWRIDIRAHPGSSLRVEPTASKATWIDHYHSAAPIDG